MANIKCSGCGYEFEDSGVSVCPMCKKPQDNQAFAEETDVAEEIVEVEEAGDDTVETADLENENADDSAETDEKEETSDFAPTEEFEYSAPFSSSTYTEEEAEKIYNEIAGIMESIRPDTTYVVYKRVAEKLEKISGYKNADDLRKMCLETAEVLRKDGLYKSALTYENSRNIADIERAVLMLSRIIDWKDAREHIEYCNEKIDLLRSEGDVIQAKEEAPLIAPRIDREKAIRENRSGSHHSHHSHRSHKSGRTGMDIKNLLFIAVPSAVAVIAAITLLTIFLIVPTVKYNNAVNLIESGDYNDAYSILAASEFKDSEDKTEIIVILSSIDKGVYKDASTEEINGIVKAFLNFNHDVRIIYNHNYEIDGAYKKETADISCESPFEAVATPERQGYEFVKWILGDAGFEDNKPRLTLRAVWNGDYTITVDLDGGTKKDENGKTINYPDGYTAEDKEDVVIPNPTREGYTFAGWTGTGISDKEMNLKITVGSSGDKEYKANWTANEYSLTFDAGEGTVSQTSAKVVYGNDYALPTPNERKGYTFEGWTDEKGNVIGSTGKWGVASNLKLTAKWEMKVYNITYKGAENAEHSNMPFYTIATESITLRSPKMDGYKFSGWYSDSAYKNKITTLDTTKLADITIYAKWKANEYSIDYNCMEFLLDDTMVTKFKTDELVTAIKLPEIESDQFLYWVDDQYNEVTEITEPGNVSVRAMFYDDDDGIYYLSDAEGFVVYSYTYIKNKNEDVNLSGRYRPSGIRTGGGYVVGIAAGAFKADGSKIESVNLGNSLLFIGDSAFEGCDNDYFTSIVIPDTVLEIGSDAFYGCDNLKIKCEAASKPSDWDKDWNGDVPSSKITWGA